MTSLPKGLWCQEHLCLYALALTSEFVTTDIKIILCLLHSSHHEMRFFFVNQNVMWHYTLREREREGERILSKKITPKCFSFSGIHFFRNTFHLPQLVKRLWQAYKRRRLGGRLRYKKDGGALRKFWKGP